MLTYPHIDPIALSLGPFDIRWYGLSYLVGILGAWFLSARRLAQSPVSEKCLEDLLFFSVLGIILGGRCGYYLFYAPHLLWENPLEVLQIWLPGMSFHGGFLGVLLAVAFVARKHKLTFLTVTDYLAPVVPIGLAAGRIGNFINGELWGRVTEMPWGMVFPGAGPLPRHPWPLYASALEGVLLFIILWTYSAAPRKVGRVSAVFALGYGVIRFADEFFRVPDPQYGFIAWGWLTMGQLLSIPLIVVGLVLWQTAKERTQ